MIRLHKDFEFSLLTTDIKDTPFSVEAVEKPAENGTSLFSVGCYPLPCRCGGGFHCLTTTYYLLAFVDYKIEMINNSTTTASKLRTKNASKWVLDEVIRFVVVVWRPYRRTAFPHPSITMVLMFELWLKIFTACSRIQITDIRLFDEKTELFIF